jgi:hypothetical protein
VIWIDAIHVARGVLHDVTTEHENPEMIGQNDHDDDDDVASGLQNALMTYFDFDSCSYVY